MSELEQYAGYDGLSIVKEDKYKEYSAEVKSEEIHENTVHVPIFILAQKIGRSIPLAMELALKKYRHIPFT